MNLDVKKFYQSHSMKIMKSNRRAFSLIEILVVLAIISILMGVAFTSFKGTGAQEFTASVAEVSGVLELSRSHAFANQTAVRVLFGIDKNDVVIMPIAYVPGGTPEGDSDTMSNNETWGPILKPVVVKKIKFNNAIAPAGVEMLLLGSKSYGTATRRVGGQNISFNYTLQFAPSGEVTLDNSVSSNRGIQWGMESIGSKPYKAVFRITRLTGRVAVFREENFKDL